MHIQKKFEKDFLLNEISTNVKCLIISNTIMNLDIQINDSSKTSHPNQFLINQTHKSIYGSNLQPKNIRKRLEAKQGLIRGNLMGLPVNNLMQP